MCVVKTPKVKANDPANQPKDPIVIRNPYLDGTGPQLKALRTGRSSLRIERAGSGAVTSAPPASSTPTARTPLPIAALPTLPVRGGGTGVGWKSPYALKLGL